MLEIEDVEGRSPLEVAAVNDTPQAMQLLLEHGAGELTTESLVAVAKSGEIESLERVIGTVDDLDRTNARGELALVEAVRSGNPQCVLALLEAGASPNAQDQTNQTAIMVAVKEDTVEAARFLLQHGASGWSLSAAYGTAMMEKKIELKALLYQPSLDDGLLSAAESGHLPSTSAMLSLGASPNATRRDGNSALILAAREGHVTVVRRLLDVGASWTWRNDDGLTAREIALRNGREEVAEILSLAEEER